jgi:hypothetical protein
LAFLLDQGNGAVTTPTNPKAVKIRIYGRQRTRNPMAARSTAAQFTNRKPVELWEGGALYSALSQRERSVNR